MWHELWRGTLAGIMATGPMTGFMQAGRRLLPWREQYPLPPRQITMEVARQTGIRDELDSVTKQWATALAHFGYGGAMGGLYAGGVRKLTGGGILSGIGWGLTVWSSSYLGALPALGILSPATQHPARRNALMIAAHVVWGAALEACLQHLEDNQQSDVAQDHQRQNPGGERGVPTMSAADCFRPRRN